MSALDPSTSRRWQFAGPLLATIVPLLFAAYTHEAWEDYYITLRSSRNLAEGHGLVYQLGEKVHTFTSPLGVLVPALGFKLTGGDVGALWFLRAVGVAALAIAATLVLRHARAQAWPPAAVALAVVLGLLEAKVVACSVNGMETAFLVLFTVLTWTELTRAGGPRWLALAAGYAGLMWTRPDACIPAAAMTVAAGLFCARPATEGVRSWWRALPAALLVGGALYAPWFFWAWHYYGSPVPQTIVAKSIYMPPVSAGSLLLAPWRTFVTGTPLDDIFMPIYAARGWPVEIVWLGRLLARGAALLWLVPALSRPARAASLALLLGSFYLQHIMPYPWYFAPWTLLGALALAGGAAALLAERREAWRATARIAATVVAGVALLLTLAQAWSARWQQRLIEDEGRRRIGLWLRERAEPHDTVFLEPIGYIGYFSQLKILDYPGLVAPEVSRIIRSGPGGYARLIRELRPDWIVLRPYELAQQNLLPSGALADYQAAGLWTQRDAVEAIDFLPGRAWLEFDSEFVVFRRKTSAAVKGP